MLDPVAEKVVDDFLPISLLWAQRFAVVEIPGEELLQLGALRIGGGTEGGDTLGVAPDVIDVLYARGLDPVPGVFKQVGDQVIQHALQRLVEFELVADAREFLLNLTEVAVENCDLAAELREAGADRAGIRLILDNRRASSHASV